MPKRPGWLQTMLSDAASRTIATLLAGALVPILLGIMAALFSGSLLQDVVVPLGMLIILALFAFIGLLASVLRLVQLLRAHQEAGVHPSPRDSILEQTTSDLLARLAEVETGKQIFVPAEVDKYHATTLALFDRWDASIEQYLGNADQAAIRDLRSQIASRSLQHSTTQARDWVLKVKDHASKARLELRRPQR